MSAVFQRSVAITSIQILSNSIKINMEYLGSSLYEDGYITISPDTHLEIGENGVKAGLIKAEGIAISPLKTTTKKNELYKFSLYFEKRIIPSNELFNLIEEEKSISAFNFWGVSLSNNEKPFIGNIPENDYFLSKIPYLLQSIFEQQDFIESAYDIRERLDKLIEFSQEKDLPEIDKISTQTINSNGKIFLAYDINHSAINNCMLSTYYFDPNESGKRVNTIMFYFDNDVVATRFYNSITDWFYPIGKNQTNTICPGFGRENTYMLVISKRTLTSKAFTVQIEVLTAEEFKKRKEDRNK